MVKYVDIKQIDLLIRMVVIDRYAFNYKNILDQKKLSTGFFYLIQLSWIDNGQVAQSGLERPDQQSGRSADHACLSLRKGMD